MNLIEINDKPYMTITLYELNKDQLWKEGSGRNPNDGVWYGTLLGNFTNLAVEVFPLNGNQLAQLESDLLSGNIKVKFYDTRTKSTRTKYFYRANYKINIKGFYDEGTQIFYDKVKISFVSRNPD